MSKAAICASRDNYNFQKIVVVLGFSLMAVKFSAYFLTNSVAILTDAMESIVNCIAGCIGLYALYLSACPADKTHPYGHGKIEVISSSIEGTMITIAGLLIIYESILNLINPKPISDLDIGLVLIALAALANYVVGRAAIAKGKKNRSPALEASGRHLCTDTYSSIGIILGLSVVFIAMQMNINVWWMDPGIALLFGSLIIITGVRVIHSSLDDIMDKADEEILANIVDCLNEHRSEDWIDIHSLRIIKYGSVLHIEFHITLPYDMTIMEEEREKSRLKEAVTSKYGDSVDLILSPEPCHDFSCPHCGRVCEHRKSEFIGHMDWNVRMLSQKHQHALGNRVIFVDDCTKK
ncbi:MAG: cation diffusion facilitator family transporter [Candidatus Methanomethylophilaceae archaeon]|nr:cation diffusion facilitator family transporter [Candidatus Methanomethylophilaceae archaeon]MDD3378925.1 cation diffusion facilitator family transporter [Candidatus Methanomethylophilaceae archaeon]MDY0224057.1 cation diffusion facilitator family transporter [Candidatus Methanomethylophilaceae archaeon]